MSAQKNAASEAAFVAWLLEGGASFPKLEWPVYDWPGQPHDGERGVQCTMDIAPAEEMFSIPESMLFNRAACLASPIAGIFKEHRQTLFSDRDELALTLLLLYEKLERGEASPWGPMIRALPEDPGAASLWTERELDLLQDDALRAEALIKAAQIEHTYKETFMPIVQKHNLFLGEHGHTCTLSQFRWALLCVESRTFGRFLPLPSLVPFADLLNHVNVHTSYRWDPQRAAAVYSCDASGLFPHLKGSEAFMSYGPRSNAELLLHYGFALANNRYESVSLQLRLHTRHHSKGTPCIKTFTTLLRPGVLNMELICLFRRIVDEGSWDAALPASLLGGSAGAGGGCLRPEDLTQPAVLNAAVEIKALWWLRECMMRTLESNFATTVEEDEILLHTADFRCRQALLYRMSRKRVFVSYIALLALAIQHLQRRCPPHIARSVLPHGGAEEVAVGEDAGDRAGAQGAVGALRIGGGEGSTGEGETAEETEGAQGVVGGEYEYVVDDEYLEDACSEWLASVPRDFAGGCAPAVGVGGAEEEQGGGVEGGSLGEGVGGTRRDWGGAKDAGAYSAAYSAALGNRCIRNRYMPQDAGACSAAYSAALGLGDGGAAEQRRDARHHVLRHAFDAAVGRRLENRKDKKAEHYRGVRVDVPLRLQMQQGLGEHHERSAGGEGRGEEGEGEWCGGRWEAGLRAVSCGEDFSAVVTASGQLWTHGDNSSGKLGHARTEFDCGPSVSGYTAYLRPRVVAALLHTRVVAVGCGKEHMAAVDARGAVYAWGSNSAGQCGLAHKCQQVLRPACVAGFGSEGGSGEGGGEREEEGRGARQGRAEDERGCAGEERALSAGPGQGRYGHAVAVACGDEFCVVLCRDGDVYAWGRNHEGQCGIGVSSGAHGCLTSPHHVMRNVADTEKAGGDKSAVGRGHGAKGNKDKSGKKGGAGGRDSGGGGGGKRGQAAADGRRGTALAALAKVVRIAASGQQACAVVVGGGSGAGTLLCWGCAQDGRLGVGRVDALPVDADGLPHAPAALPALAALGDGYVVSFGVTAVGMAREYTALVTAEQGRSAATRNAMSALLVAGRIRAGTSALEEEESASDGVFREVMMLSELGQGDEEVGVVDVACGAGDAGHMLVRMADGSLRETGTDACAGGGARAEVGDRRRVGIAFRRVAVGGAGGVVAVACGARHSMALCLAPGRGAEAQEEEEGEGTEEGQELQDTGVGTSEQGPAVGHDIYVWGHLERGELGVPVEFGAVQRLLQSRLVPVTLGVVTHAGTVCCMCRCDSIKGVRYAAVGAAFDICARCMDKHASSPSADFIGNRHIMLVSARKLPPAFRPRLTGVDAASLQESLSAQSDEQPSSFTHAGVACRACGAAPIVGCRFVCGNCVRDYSLCQSCYAKHQGQHLSTHLFLRIPRPVPQLSQSRAASADGGMAPLLPLLFPQLTTDVFVT